MSTGVVVAVLASAGVHAIWNALIKGRGDPLTASTGLALSWALGGGMLLPWIAPPAPAAWPWLAASLVVHVGYLSALVVAYRRGDLSVVYPLMRGTPPIAVLGVSSVVLAEPLAPGAGLGAALVIGGVIVLTRGLPSRAVLLPTAIAAACIATYTVLDGLGVRASGATASYLAWLMTLQGACFAAGALAIGRRPLLQAAARRWRTGLASGILSSGGYLVALWAMTQAPIAPVAALRETSVVFAALLGACVLGEPFGVRRGIAVALVAAGAAALRLG